MKHRITIFLAGSSLLLAAVACSSGGGDTKGPDLSGTAAALSATQTALANSSVAQPATEEPAASATEEDTVATSPDFYTEEFDTVPQDWTYVTYTGAANSDPGQNFDIYAQDGRLVFDIPDANVWTYYGPDSWSYTDVRLDARAENLGNNNNNVTLFCRYNDRGWYEFNVANNGLYNIYRYEVSTDSYNELYSGGVKNLKTGKATNDFTIICQGDSLTLGVNGTEVRTVKDSQYDDGLVGVGVSSFSGVPVRVEFDYVEISQP